MARNKVTIVKDNRSIRKKHWLVRWYGKYDPSIGKQKRLSKSFRTKIQAERFAEQQQSDFNEGSPRDFYDITLEELCNKFINTRRKTLANSTIKDYEGVINRLKNYFNPSVSIKHIRQEDAEEFISTLEIVHPDHKRSGKEISGSTRNKILKSCKTIFNVASEWEYIKKNPFKKIKAQKAKKKNWHYLSPVEFKAVLSKVSDTRLKAFYSVMYGCGLRYGEATNLLWDGKNIDFEKNRLNIIGRKGSEDIPVFSIKDHENRSIPVPKWVIDILSQLQVESKESCPFVFLTETRWQRVKSKWHKMKASKKAHEWDNDKLMNNVLRTFQAHCRKAGINTNDTLTIHTLRKAYGTNLANASTPVQTLKELMGHASIQTTMEFYLYSSDANEQKACEALDRIMEMAG